MTFLRSLNNQNATQQNATQYGYGGGYGAGYAAGSSSNDDNGLSEEGKIQLAIVLPCIFLGPCFLYCMYIYARKCYDGIISCKQSTEEPNTDAQNKV
jgi:hypothetical protein